jgi:hypothetical protein
MLGVGSIVAVALFVAWFSAELRGKTLSRVALAMVALCAAAVLAIAWVCLAAQFKDLKLPVPHDSPEDTLIMDRTEQPITNAVNERKKQ